MCIVVTRFGMTLQHVKMVLADVGTVVTYVALTHVKLTMTRVDIVLKNVDTLYYSPFMWHYGLTRVDMVPTITICILTCSLMKLHVRCQCMSLLARLFSKIFFKRMFMFEIKDIAHAMLTFV